MDTILYVIQFILIAILVWFSALIINLIYYEIYYATLRYETFPCKAKVCRKEYKKEYYTYGLVGKMPTSIHHDEEFNVYLLYNNEEYCIDDKKLYNSVKIGGIVHVLVHKGYNKKHKLKYVYLSTQ